MSWIGDMVKNGLKNAVDGVKKDAQYEVRRMGRRTMGQYLDGVKKKVAVKVKPKLDNYLEKHPARVKAQQEAQVQAKEQAEKVAKKVKKEVEQTLQTPTPVVEVTPEDEVRQIEF